MKKGIAKCMMDLVTVIIPVYNVEQYVDDCLSSIVNQTYKNLEIILVDDGSTDSSGEKCDDWEERDSRIKAIHQKNQGLSGARNTALDICQGEWIVFVDSDDIVDTRYVEVLLTLAKKYQVKIVQCENAILGETFELTNVVANVMSKKEFLLSERFRVTAWGKIYAKELFGKMRYPLGKIHEDLATTYKLIYEVEAIAYTNEVLYFQNVRDESINSKTRFYLGRLDALRFRKEQIDFYKGRNEKELAARAIRDYAYALLENYEKVKNVLKRPDIAKKLKYEYRQLWKELKQDKEISCQIRMLLRVCCDIPLLWNRIIER